MNDARAVCFHWKSFSACQMRSSPFTGWCFIIYCLLSLAVTSLSQENVDKLEINATEPSTNSVEENGVLTIEEYFQNISSPEEGGEPDENDVTEIDVESAEILQITPEQVPPVTSLDFVVNNQTEEVKESDNLVNVVNNTTRTNESGSNEDDIPSFSEWTQKVLAEEEKSGANGSTSVPVIAKTSTAAKLRQKNYASPDCGSKILAANSEAEHTSAVLDPARDEYFLSICSAKIWFVIELCEAIQAQRVEIANFELFSSSPKDFKVYISDRYPTRDWALLGQFTATDERSIQSFQLERQLFGKFVKVELISHYGREHFCPISLFRVYGNSEYEVLDEDSRSAEHRHDEDSTEEEMLFDVKQNDSSRNLFGSAKDAVINIVKKAAEVLSKSPEAAKTINNTKLCYSPVGLFNVSRAINGSLSCQWKELNFLASLPWLHISLLRQCKLEETSYSSQELAFAKLIWGASTVQALCHWLSPEEHVVPVEQESVIMAPVVTVVVQNQTPISEALAEIELELSDLDALDQLFDDEIVTLADLLEKPAQPPAPQQQKESVFVRLSNRIKVLERNMSLSGQYLEELSRRYKRQVDDMQKTLNRTLQTLNDTLQRMSSQEERYEASLNSLYEQIVELRTTSQQLAMENFSMRAQMMEQHLFLMLLEVVVIAAVVMFLLPRRRPNPPNPPPSSPLPAIIASPQPHPSCQSKLTLDVVSPRLLTVQKKQQTSPAPSLADSSSSGCESAFSFPTHAASRDPSPVERAQSWSKANGKKHKKKKNQENKAPKMDNIQQWNSRAKILATEFIKENSQTIALRSSF